ncbi:MAG: hypothetical protein Q8P44_00015 [Dehalococcoidia bacterium]|nr:hypothetical protein [Dehalococcoidia bacterium]
MLIKIKSNFEVRGISEHNLVEFQGEGITLRKFLEEMSEKGLNGLELFNSSDEINTEDFLISLNGKEYPFLPDKLDTRLKDGDIVEINVLVLGGG